MSVVNEFENTLYEAAEKKVAWFDTYALPKVLENYRAFHSAIKNMTGIFEKKKLLVPDPYKKDKRVADIIVPETEDFPDSEGPNVLGIRLSDYESSLDFLCNYLQFTVSALQPERIKKLFLFNSFLDWNNISDRTTQSNTRYFSFMVTSIKTGSDTLSAGLLNNMLALVASSISEINAELKNLIAIQRQLYKIDVRKKVFNSSSFISTYNNMTVENGVAEIKKNFPTLMEKKRFYPDLINELVQEDFGPSKEALRKKVLDVFQTSSEKQEESEKAVDTRAMIFEVVKMLQSFSSAFDVVQQKIQENHDLLQSEKKSGFAKFVMAIRAAFGIRNKTIEYKIKVVDMYSHAEKIETIDYNKFMDNMNQRSRVFQSLGVKNSPVLSKLEAENEEGILAYVQKRISDCQSLYGALVGFDNFFKAEVVAANRPKVKGLKIDLDVIKNIILKVNKHKAEYVSTVTTEQQMKKLGMINE